MKKMENVKKSLRLSDADRKVLLAYSNTGKGPKPTTQYTNYLGIHKV